MIDRKVIGSIFLIGSMAIGAGMLALPVALAKTGFIPSIILILSSWVYMTFTAFLLLEINMKSPLQSNMISMVRSTLGRPMEAIAWLIYLSLLYALLSAYISGGSDLIHKFFIFFNMTIPSGLEALIFVFSLGFIVIGGGVYAVDQTNRVLVIAKIILYLTLIFILIPKVKNKDWMDMQFTALIPAIPVVATAFGFSIIIPTLRGYLSNNIQKLRISIFLGSLLPLIFFTVWIVIIFGTIPRYGEQGLISILGSPHEVTLLALRLHQSLQNNFISDLFYAFSTISLLTAFLGVSLSLTDFLSDGFNIPKRRQGLIIIAGITFLPPLAIVWFNPSLFILGLKYAGIFIIVLMGLFPALMAWISRYSLKEKGYEVWGGKAALSFSIVISLALLIQSIIKFQ